MLLINTDLRLKLVFDNLTLSCDAPIGLVVNIVLDSGGISKEFVQGQADITMYTNFTVNLIITNT
jgi:hypothetical protein